MCLSIFTLFYYHAHIGYWAFLMLVRIITRYTLYARNLNVISFSFLCQVVAGCILGILIAVVMRLALWSS